MITCVSSAGKKVVHGKRGKTYGPSATKPLLRSKRGILYVFGHYTLIGYLMSVLNQSESLLRAIQKNSDPRTHLFKELCSVHHFTSSIQQFLCTRMPLQYKWKRILQQLQKFSRAHWLIFTVNKRTDKWNDNLFDATTSESGQFDNLLS